jgi:hypothetical protein
MIRRLLITAALVAAATVAGPSSPAQAFNQCPAGYMCLTTFWADQAHTHWNGSHSVNCDGVILNLGTLQGFITYSQSSCGGAAPVGLSRHRCGTDDGM